MSKLERKIKRRKAQQEERKAKKELARQLNNMQQMPNNCSSCDKKFDRKSKQHAMTWKVVAYNDKSKIRLFCPDCIEKTKRILDENKLDI